VTIEEPAGSRAQFLAYLQQFMDRTLKDLDRAVEAEDADEKEIIAIRSVLLKIGSGRRLSPMPMTILDR
jgi:hypothetical protein